MGEDDQFICILVSTRQQLTYICICYFHSFMYSLLVHLIYQFQCTATIPKYQSYCDEYIKVYNRLEEHFGTCHYFNINIILLYDINLTSTIASAFQTKIDHYVFI